MTFIARALIVAGILFYSGLNTNAYPNTQSIKQKELISWKIPENSCPNGIDESKTCSQCYQNGYVHFDAKIPATDQGCSDDDPLTTFIETDEYNNNNHDTVSCQTTEEYHNHKSKMNAWSTGIPNILEYSRFIGCFNYEGEFPLNISLTKTNSNKHCLLTCQLKRFKYAGTHNGSFCLCTNKKPENRAEDDFLCEKLSCPGEPTEKCGSEDKIKLYQTELLYENHRHPQYIGCYNIEYDTSCDRYKHENPLSCIATCKKEGFNYSSFNFSSGNQCICHHLPPPKIRKTNESNCSNIPSDSSIMMVYDNGVDDNPYALNAYVFINYYKLRNYPEAEPLKTINTTFNNSLITNCHRYCMKSGFQLFSIHVKNMTLNGENCFCSTVKEDYLKYNLSSKRSDTSWIADVFLFETGLSDVDIDEKMDTNTTKCYQMNEDKELWTDTETSTFLNVETLTPKTCQMICDYLRYSYSAVEKGSDCHCFNNLEKKKKSTLTDMDCNVRCLGDRFQTCGGSAYRMKVSKTPFGQKIVESVNQPNIHELEKVSEL